MAGKKQETDTMHFMPLPEEGSGDYFRVVVHNCIVAYSRLLNDKLALDYNKVIGKTRALVLADMEYQCETRSIYSRRMWEEVDKMEQLVDMADAMGTEDSVEADDFDSVDPRNRKKKREGKKKPAAADKDMLNMQFKALQARREMLNLSADNETAEETNALNAMFVPLTKEEFEKLKTVEIFDGTDDTTGTFGSAGGGSKEAPDGRDGLRTVHVEELYTTDANGDIIEL
jgi:hypothetical protein